MRIFQWNFEQAIVCTQIVSHIYISLTTELNKILLEYLYNTFQVLYIIPVIHMTANCGKVILSSYCRWVVEAERLGSGSGSAKSIKDVRA